MRLFVNDALYDDVGQVLRRFGQGFEYLAADQLGGYAASESVLFLNCGGPVSFSADQLRAFVESGGTVYASDLQAPFIASIFPGVLEAENGGGPQTIQASIVDQGLRAIVGATIRLEFDLGAWQYLRPSQSMKDAVRTYVEAGSNPLLVSYQPSPGSGTIYYTAFHNVKQNSEEEKEMLRFLLFRPIMSRDTQLSASTLASQSLTIEREYTGGLRKDSIRKSFEIPAAGRWTAQLSWQGQGRLKVSFESSSGAVLAEADKWVSPLTLVAADVPERSRVAITYEEFVQPEIAFVLHLASGGTPKSGRLKGSLAKKSGV